jgi:5-methylcytosine-specific restriction endonuclease McrA
VVNSESQWRVERHWLSDHTEQDECPNMTVEYVPYDGPIVTRAEALARGLPRWFIGKSCKRDHISERRTTDGVCVACVHALTNAWKTANREKINAAERESRLRDPETYKARVAKYQTSDKGKATLQAYRLANAEAARKRAKAWKEQNPERALENRARYYEANKERVVAKVAEWNAANPDGQRTRGRNYRAKLYAAEGSHTREQIQALHDSQGGKCVYCRVSLKDGYHADHIRPLSKGGSNWIANIQLTCGPCNNRKRAADPIIYAQRLGRLL